MRRWLPRFGFEKLEVMLAANNNPPPLFVRINTIMTPIEQVRNFQDSLLRDEHLHSDRINFKGGLTLKKHPEVGPESLFAKGYYTIQDQASQLIPQLLNINENETILDAAAGPGGKFAHIYELGRGTLNLIGVEKDAIQMRRAKETLERLGHKDGITWVEQDFLQFKPDTKIDKILLDAPCTGLGVLRRHPEGKWHKEAAGITQLAEVQRQMITHALSLLKTDGELVYSVCSFEPEETEDHLVWLKKEYGAKVEIISPVSRLPDYFKRYVTRDNILMIYAGNQDDMDGFGAFCIKWKG